MQRARWSLRTTITIPFILLIVATVGLVSYLSFTTGSEAVNDVSAELRQKAYTQTLEHLNSFLEAPHQVNRLNKNYIEMSGLELDDPVALQNYFWQQLQIFDTTSYIYFGNNAGGIMLVARRSDGSFVSRLTDGFAAGKSTVYAMSDDGLRREILQRREFYDSRERPWYKQAKTEGGPVWTELYTFFLESTLGITASLPLLDHNGELLGVLSTDILLSHIHNHLARLTADNAGEIFILEPSGLLVASSHDPQPFTVEDEGKRFRRINAGDSASPLIRTAYQQLQKKFPDLTKIDRDHHLEFDLDGRHQFLQLSPYRDQRGIDWLIAIAVPESAFMAKLIKNTYLTVALCLLALMIAIILSFYLARRVTVPLSNLKQAALSLTTGNWGQQIPDNGTEEIHSLANSFNIMAQQLQGSFSRLKKNNQELKDTQAALRQANRELTQRVENRTSELDKSEERYKQLAEATFEGVVFHAGNIILDTNSAFQELLGYAPEEIKGRSLVELALPEHRGRLERSLASAHSVSFEAAFTHKNRESIILRLRSTTLPLHGEEVKVTVLRETDSPHDNRFTNGQPPTTDPLTNLHNLRHFQKLAGSELLKAQRFERPFTLLLLDIDNLSSIRETYGYGMGDEAARTVAHICNNQLRDIDIVGRTHGGEFLAVLTETHYQAAERIAEQLKNSVAATSVHHQGYSLRISISTGIGVMKQHEEPFDEILRRADLALHNQQSKENGLREVNT